MEVSRILAEIDAQIAKLQQARALLSDDAPATSSVRRGPGRPKGSTNTAAASKTATKKSAKKSGARRILSPEARKRIADAQKKRWAASRKEKSA